MQVTPSHITISQFFLNNTEQFEIPAYQRRYAWNDKQLGELYDDINLLKNGDTHLLSSVVFLTSAHTGGINTIEVVDGQQRITTLSLLFLALRTKFQALNDEDNVKEISKMLICSEFNKQSKNKLKLGELDNPDYQILLNSGDKNKIKNQNIIHAYEFYLKELPQEKQKLEEFYYKVKYSLFIIRLDVSFAKDAYRLFEAINNRGLRLSPTDIIKNFILGNASQDTESSTLLGVKDSWQELIINLDGIVIDNFFRQYLSGKINRKIPMSKMVGEFKRYYSTHVKQAELLSQYSLYAPKEENNEEEELIDASIKSEDVAEHDSVENENADIDNENTSENESDDGDSMVAVQENCVGQTEKINLKDFVKTLASASLIYSKIVKCNFTSNDVNTHLRNLQRIKSLPSYTFLLNVFERNLREKEVIEILRIIEAFMLRWHICEKRTSELDDIFPKLINLPNDNIVVELRKELLNYAPNDNEFGMRLREYNFKGNFERAKYVLEQIEYSLAENQNEYILTSGKDLHLEHIIPQKIATKKSKKEFGDWELYLGADSTIEHKKYLNNIGNLTLLAQKLNIKASNNPFLSKKKEYRKSALLLNKQLVSGYGKFKFKEVKKRAELLSKRAIKIWDI